METHTIATADTLHFPLSVQFTQQSPEPQGAQEGLCLQEAREIRGSATSQASLEAGMHPWRPPAL